MGRIKHRVSREARTSILKPYKGHTLETWSTAPHRYEGRVWDGPTFGKHNAVYGTSRAKVLADLKASVDKEACSVKGCGQPKAPFNNKCSQHWHDQAAAFPQGL